MTTVFLTALEVQKHLKNAFKKSIKYSSFSNWYLTDPNFPFIVKGYYKAGIYKEKRRSTTQFLVTGKQESYKQKVWGAEKYYQ